MFEQPFGVYELRNTITGIPYYGSGNLEERHYKHFYHLNRGDHWNPKIRRDGELYGPESFEFNVILYSDVDRNELYALEQTYIDLPSVKYNIGAAAGGNGPHSAETRARMSAAKLDRVNTPEHNENISKAMTGRVFTEDHLRNITEANRRNAKHQHPDKGRHIRETKSSGTWKTPWGDFLSPNEAEAACPLSCSSVSIRSYCTEGKSVTKQAFTRNKWLAAQGEHIVGKSFADLGFNFTPKVS